MCDRRTSEPASVRRSVRWELSLGIIAADAPRAPMDASRRSAGARSCRPEPPARDRRRRQTPQPAKGGCGADRPHVFGGSQWRDPSAGHLLPQALTGMGLIQSVQRRRPRNRRTGTRPTGPRQPTRATTIATPLDAHRVRATAPTVAKTTSRGAACAQPSPIRRQCPARDGMVDLLPRPH